MVMRRGLQLRRRWFNSGPALSLLQGDPQKGIALFLYVACPIRTRKSSGWIPIMQDWNPMTENKHLPVRCRPSVHYYLRELADVGAYGGRSKAAVARFFVERGIVAALEAGVITKVNASALGEEPEEDE
jgi:hypothetical protein